MTYKKSITEKSVQKAAEFILSFQDTVTTLEIKQLLRENGFYAIQNEVSLLMETVFQKTNLFNYYDTGMYRIYRLNKSQNKNSYNSTISNDNISINILPVLDWIVYYKSGNTIKDQVKVQAATRGKARVIGAKKNGC